MIAANAAHAGHQSRMQDRLQELLQERDAALRQVWLCLCSTTESQAANIHEIRSALHGRDLISLPGTHSCPRPYSLTLSRQMMTLECAHSVHTVLQLYSRVYLPSPACAPLL